MDYHYVAHNLSKDLFSLHLPLFMIKFNPKFQ